MTTRLERALTYAILIVLVLLVAFPLVGIALLAIHPHGELVSGFSVPASPTLDTFPFALNVGNFTSYVRSSIFVAVCVSVGATFLSILSGYALGTMRFRGSGLVFGAFLLGLVVPFEALIVPLYYDLGRVGLTDTYWALILPQMALSLSFGTIWMRAFFRSLPRTLLEAARMDGASSWRVLWRVLVPLGIPAVFTLTLLLFIWTWNEFFLVLVMAVGNENIWTVPIGLTFFSGRYSTDLPGLAAGSIIVALPIVLLYVVLQRHFFRGLLSGSLRG